MPRKYELKLEALEAREVPTVFGTPWPNASGLTISFAADGTKIAGYQQSQYSQEQPSALFNELNGMGTATWQTEILRAFQTWAVHTNLNFGLVPDSGAAFGPESLAPGTAQGGDIRIGALALSPEVVAIAQPYNVLTGAWSGDVLLNTAQTFSLNAQSGAFRLFSIFLHESANALGLADSNDPTSARYGSYRDASTALTTADIAAIQNLYGGARKADAFDTAAANGTSATATKLTNAALPNDASKYMVSARGDLTTLTDVDWYEIKTRGDTSNMYVRLETVGKSMLGATVSVYSSSGALLTTQSGTGPLQTQDLLRQISAQPNTTYRIKVEKARSDVFGIGGYELKVGYNFDPVGATPSATVQVLGNDGNTNNTFATATKLTPFARNGSTVYQAFAHMDGTSDKDYYWLTAPKTASPSMTVVVQPPKSYQLFAEVTVFTSAGQVVPSEVLVNGDGGRYVVQVANPVAGEKYRILVEAVGQNGNYLAGDYDLSVEFSTPAVQRATVTQGTMTDADRVDYLSLGVPEARVYNFALDATSSNPSVVSGVRMTIFNTSGQVVGTLSALAGQTATGTFLLPAGTYYLRFDGATRTGAALPNLSYRLRAVVVSDPIDMLPPPNPTAPPPPPFTLPPPPPLPVLAELPPLPPWIP